MGIVMLNGELYGGGGKSTTRFISDVNDENYGWIQYKDENGEWVNWNYLLETEKWLYTEGQNLGEFSAYAGTVHGYSHSGNLFAPTVTFGESMTITQTQFGSESSGATHGVGAGCVISKSFDLTNFSKLTLHHSTSCNDTDGGITYVKVAIVSSKASKMTASASVTLLSAVSQTSASGDVELDISSLKGEYYIAIDIENYLNTKPKTVISNMKLVK